MDPVTNWIVLYLGGALFILFFQPRLSANRQLVAPEDQPEPIPLATFIDDNHKLITTLGVLTALTVFVSNLPIKLFGSLLSFLFLIATILTWQELISKFPKSKTVRLFWFQNVLDAAVPVLVLFLILQFRSLIRPFMNYILLLAVMWLGYLLIDRLKIFELVEEKTRNRRLGYIVEGFICALIFGVYFALSFLLSPVFDSAFNFLDTLVAVTF